MKVMPVFGTRPEAIKMAPIIQEIARRSSQIEQVICVTAQHREMLDQVLDLFSITPEYDLGVMSHNQTPAQVAAAVLRGLEPLIEREKPDWILVQGDTTTVAAAALAAFYKGVKVGHVEAGLRTYDKWHPFPEEINRRVAGVLADLHFAPTQSAQGNLLREGIAPEAIVVTGNSVIDALEWVGSRLDADPSLVETAGPAAGVLERLGERRLIVATLHRRENIGEPAARICSALRRVAMENADVVVAVPVHPNPNIRGPISAALAGLTNVILLPPLDYLPLVALLRRAYLVLTDSGGIQEEAPSLGVPVLVSRQTTERPEAVTAGTVKLVGSDADLIHFEMTQLLNDPTAYQMMARAVNPYGDGRAAQRIVGSLLGEPIDALLHGNRLATVSA